MATIAQDGKLRAVKNLGWLLRHWQEVESLGFNWAPDHKQMIDGQLVARLRTGAAYFCDYASLPVCWNWLDRPVFRGLPFRLVRIHDPNDGGDNKRVFTIGDANWRAINQLDHKTFTCFVLSDCVELPKNDFYAVAR